MENLKIFENEKFGKIRLITKENDDILLNLNDTSVSLGYTKKNAIGKEYLRKDLITNIAETLDIQGVSSSDTSYKITKDINFDETYITEDSFYDLCLESKVKHAREFRKWITNEVIPSIRKHGTYMTDETLNQAISDPKFMIALLEKLKETQERNSELEKESEDYKAFMRQTNGIDMDIVANLLKLPNMGRNKLFEWLRNKKVLMDGERQNIPYARYNKHFEVVEINNNGLTFEKCLVRPSGIKLITKLIKKEKELLSAVQ